jgi:hypothetical protein
MWKSNTTVCAATDRKKYWPFLISAIGLACSVAENNVAFGAERYVTVYAGKYTDDKLGEVLTNKPITFEHSYLGVVALAHTLGETRRPHQWELEVQIGKHGGVQTHWEFNILPVIRWKRFPWNEFLTTTVAIGDGLSYATEVPSLEQSSLTNERAARLLNYFLFEMTVAPPDEHRWSIVTRVHHRSGVFGMFNDVHGGSNVIAVGV